MALRSLIPAKAPNALEAPARPAGGHRRVKTTTALVANPFYSENHPESATNPRQVAAIVNLRESSIVTMAAHGQLDGDQVAAAWRFRRAFETVSAIRPAVLDPDGIRGGKGDGIAERQLNAATYLRSARQLLGAHGYELVGRICGEGYHIRDLCPTRRERDTATDLLKIHLSALAGMER